MGPSASTGRGWSAALFEAAPCAFLRVDDAAAWADLNSAAAALLGPRTAARLRGRPLEDLAVPGSGAGLAAAAERACTAGETVELEVVATTDAGPRLVRLSMDCVSPPATLLVRAEDRTAASSLGRAAAAPSQVFPGFRAHPAPLLLVRPGDGAILDANRAAERLYGASAADLGERGLAGLLDVAAPEAQEALARARAPGGDAQRHRDATGAWHDVAVRGGPLAGGADSPWLCVVDDRAAQARAEEDLRSSEARLQRTVGGADDALFDWQPASDEVWISERYERMLGFEPGELELGYAQWRKRVHPDDLERVERRLRAHFDEGEPYDAVFRMQRRDERWLWVRARGRAYRDESGEVQYFSGSVRDVDAITRARKREEERHARERRQKESLLRLTTDPAFVDEGLAQGLARITEEACAVLGCGRATVLLFDPGGHRLTSHDLYVAAKCRHFRGFEIDHERAPRYFASLSGERAIAVEDAWQDERMAEFGEEYLRERAVGALLDAPIRARGRLDGVLRLEEVGAPRAWAADEVDYAVGLAGQVARLLVLERERAAEADRLRVREQMLRARELESLGRLAGGVAHEFNNLLLCVLGNADVALETLPVDAPEREQLRAIDEAARRSAELCRQMLACSGRGAVLMRALDLSRLVGEMEGLLRVAVGRRARLRLRLQPDPPPVLGDAVQFRQLTMNLVSRAAATADDPASDITVSTGVRRLGAAALRDMPPYSGRGPGEYAFIQVEDAGPSLDPEERARLFEPFYTAHDPERGLGMPAALGIVLGHGGALDVHDRPGGGTAVQALLPLASEDARREPHAQLGPPRRDGRPVRVLLVDDDEDALQPCAAMLDLVGYEVTAVRSGAEALEVFERAPHDVDVVVLDLLMPRMDGSEAFDHLRALRSDVPIVITSGFAEDEVREKFAGRGMSGYLEKPYTLRTLSETLERALDGDD